jgi:uncharacterized protein YbbC (DUF1343 family)
MRDGGTIHVTHATTALRTITSRMLHAMTRIASVCAIVAALACAPASPSMSLAQQRVLPGIDVLLRDGPGPLAGKRVGLITNHTGISASPSREGDTLSTIDLLHRHSQIDLVALFSPEHSITGRADAGERVESGRDTRTGLPIHSLYSATRKPTPEMLAGIDVLVFDIQDIGTRYYTYVWTMALALEAAAEQGKKFVVLDRPNPIGGMLVHGNVLDTAFRTFVGLYPVPMRHGLTPGELARFINGEFLGGRADLTVIPVSGWRRDMWFDDTRLPWLAPSPNMPTLESATHYPGTCLFEGTNLSVGRGTPEAFRQIGAPWLDHAALARRLASYNLPGVRIDTVTFTPDGAGDGKYDRVAVRGIRFTTTDRTRYDPTRASIAALIEIRALHRDSLGFREQHFDRLAGTERVRLDVLRGAPLAEVTATWNAQLDAFRARRRPYLLYPE